MTHRDQLYITRLATSLLSLFAYLVPVELWYNVIFFSNKNPFVTFGCILLHNPDSTTPLSLMLEGGSYV